MLSKLYRSMLATVLKKLSSDLMAPGGPVYRVNGLQVKISVVLTAT
jgi:hypothetical protein